MRAKLILIIIFFFSVFAIAQDSNDSMKEMLHIEWERVEEAIAYQIEIKDASGKVIFTKKVEDTYLDFKLPEGKYILRIGVINKFKKISAWSDWSDLLVKLPPKPEFESINPNISYTGLREKGITIQGKNLIKGCKVFLKNGSTLITPRKIEYLSELLIKLNIDFTDAIEGKYDIIIENPRGRKIEQHSAFEIKKPIYPEFKSIIGNSGYKGRLRENVLIKGDNIIDGCNVYLKRDTLEIYAHNLTIKSKNLLTCDIDLKNAVEGKYDVVIENPGGFKSVKEKIFTVERSFMSSLLKSNYAYGNIKIGAGLSYYMLLPEWGNAFDNSYKNWTLIIGYKLKGIGFFRSLIIVDSMGLEFEYNQTVFIDKKETNGIKSNMKNTMYGMNIFYNSNFNTPINIIIRAGGGITQTKIEEQGARQNSYKSEDSYYKIGIAIEYRFFKFMFAELGVDYHVTQYMEENFRAIRYLALVGIRFL